MREKGWYMKTVNFLGWAWYHYNLKTCSIWGQNKVVLFPLFPLGVSIEQEILGVNKKKKFPFCALTVSLLYPPLKLIKKPAAFFSLLLSPGLIYFGSEKYKWQSLSPGTLDSSGYKDLPGSRHSKYFQVNINNRFSGYVIKQKKKQGKYSLFLYL